MTKYDELISDLETAVIRFIFNMSEFDELSAAEQKLCDAIKDLQDQAAISDKVQK